MSMEIDLRPNSEYTSLGYPLKWPDFPFSLALHIYLSFPSNEIQINDSISHGLDVTFNRACAGVHVFNWINLNEPAYRSMCQINDGQLNATANFSTNKRQSIGLLDAS